MKSLGGGGLGKPFLPGKGFPRKLPLAKICFWRVVPVRGASSGGRADRTYDGRPSSSQLYAFAPFQLGSFAMVAFAVACTLDSI